MRDAERLAELHRVRERLELGQCDAVTDTLADRVTEDAGLVVGETVGAAAARPVRVTLGNRDDEPARDGVLVTEPQRLSE